MKKEAETLADTIEELRLQIIAATTMTYDLACTESTTAKAIAQMERTSETWNLFLKEWQGLRNKIKESEDKAMKSEEFEKRTIDRRSVFSKLSRIIKRSKDD